jgi:SpoVK/Ycf46/Vps4 family AAA+-type ATPase
MYNKREKNVIKTAKKLDELINDDNEISDLATAIISDNDNLAAERLCKTIALYAKDESEQIANTSKLLMNNLIDYYGYLKILEVCHKEKEYPEQDEKTLEELLEELDRLVGLEKVKTTVNDLIAYQRVQKLRNQKGLHSQKNTMHLAFLGNPGTGKTTVARIVGRIYKKLGLLSKGHFIEVSRTDLIAGYQGQTALKVKSVIDRAKGGVLFIDEAYSITENNHSDSYGRECLTELTKALEDYRDDLVVIVAGYTKPMEEFFESNPGLKSRFNTFIQFDDYNENELDDIMKSICNENDYALSESAFDKVKEIISYDVKHKDGEFANGRLVRNLYEDLVMNHARRVNQLPNPSYGELYEITELDVPNVLVCNPQDDITI